MELKRSQGDGAAEDGASSSASDATAWLLNESTVKELLELPWFGEGIGKSASQVSIHGALCDYSSLVRTLICIA